MGQLPASDVDLVKVMIFILVFITIENAVMFSF